ncbi:MAG: HAD-IIB family hydrolase, partial [Chloroflexi bacterium]
MRFNTLACDYDGTLTLDGTVDEPTLAALERYRAAGGTLLLVTGREMDELLRIFPHTDMFERIIAENGGVLYCPQTRQSRGLADSPPAELVASLRRNRVEPLAIGRVIMATREPHQHAVLEAIHDLCLEYHIIFNKGAVMVLPSGVNKATGLKAALKELNLAPKQIAGVGDAENDHAF